MSNGTSKFKVGDKVKLVGDDDWIFSKYDTDRFMNQIGKTGEVIEVSTRFVRVMLSGVATPYNFLPRELELIPTPVVLESKFKVGDKVKVIDNIPNYLISKVGSHGVVSAFQGVTGASSYQYIVVNLLNDGVFYFREAEIELITEQTKAERIQVHLDAISVILKE